MFKEYDRMIDILGPAGASQAAAEAIYRILYAPKM